MKTALITGASRGIGEATAYQLTKEYDCVAIMSRNTDGKLNTVANQIHTTTNCRMHSLPGMYPTLHLSKNVSGHLLHPDILSIHSSTTQASRSSGFFRT